MDPSTMKQAQSEDEAREQAIAWSHWVNDQNLSYGDLAEWQEYFEGALVRFPGLRDEFVENGIV